MANLVSLEEVRTELTQYPGVMGQNSGESSEVKELLIDAKNDRERFPKFFAFLEQARTDANNASKLDSLIPFPDEILISAKVSAAQNLNRSPTVMTAEK